MPCFAMLCSCSMLMSCSEHCNLMLFLSCPVISTKSVNLLLFAIFPCPFEHVLVISGDSSVFMFCCALPVLHSHAFCFYVGVLYHIFLMLAICLVVVLDSLSFKLVSCVCVEPLLRFECALYETCLILHVVSYYHVASMFWGVCLMFVCILHQCHAELFLLISSRS